MGSFVFLCLKAAKVYETPWDWFCFCLLLALEIPQYVRLVLYWRAKR